MLYIHQNTCISPQRSFNEADLERLVSSVENKLRVIEPEYPEIPPGLLRRMGKAVRTGVGAALPLMHISPAVAGMIIGTANGGMEDCIKFLNQIIEYEEGMLTPGNFVQSTPNAIASQISLLHHNNAYNITHVHRGLSFENALIDAQMQVLDHPADDFLLGAVDEISSYNFNIDYLGGWYKKETLSNLDLYQADSIGSIAGEGAAMFLVNGNKTSAQAAVEAIRILHGSEEDKVLKEFQKIWGHFNSGGNKIDLLITGENGDNRLFHYYKACESILGKGATIARFKHMCGEFPTATAFAFWAGCRILEDQALPSHMIKTGPGQSGRTYKRILIYNTFKGQQHSFIVISKPE
jgi:hypothetical protein